jgi:hypothetical protein
MKSNTPSSLPSSNAVSRLKLHAPGDMSIFLYASPPDHQSPRGGDVGAFHGNLPQVTQNRYPGNNSIKKTSTGGRPEERDFKKYVNGS